MKVSGIFFALVVVAFLLPFMVVTCNGQKLASASGIQLAIGAKANNSMGDMGNEMSKGLGKLGDMFGMEEQAPKPEPSGNKLKPNIPALVALIMAIVGLITAFVLDPKKFFVPLGAAIVGIVCMILISSTVKSEITGMGQAQQTMVALAVKLQFGYYLAFIGFIIAGILTLIGFKSGGVETVAPVGYAQYQKPEVTPPAGGTYDDPTTLNQVQDLAEDILDDSGETVEVGLDNQDADTDEDQ